MNTKNKQHRQPFLCCSPLPATQINLELFEISRVFQLLAEEMLAIRKLGSEDYLYLVSGKIQISEPDGKSQILDAQQGQREFFLPKNSCLISVIAKEDSLLYHVDSEKLDYLIFWKELAQTMDERSHLRKRMDKLRHFPALRRLPAESVSEAIKRMNIISVKAGEEIISEGEPGDAFYVIDSGRAEVWQTGIYDDKPKKVTELDEGEAFGEEALVTGSTRNATVKMIADGELLVLEQSDFIELVSKPMIREVEAGVAKAMQDNGYQMLDVRYEEEYAVAHIPGAILFPLCQLRQRLKELDPHSRYVTYCRSGKRSAVAAFLLNQREFDVVSMRGGLLNWPFELDCWYLM